MSSLVLWRRRIHLGRNTTTNRWATPNHINKIRWATFPMLRSWLNKSRKHRCVSTFRSRKHWLLRVTAMESFCLRRKPEPPEITLPIHAGLLWQQKTTELVQIGKQMIEIGLNWCRKTWRSFICPALTSSTTLRPGWHLNLSKFCKSEWPRSRACYTSHPTTALGTLPMKATSRPKRKEKIAWVACLTMI